MILRRRQLGVAIPIERQRKMQPLLGDVHISENPNEGLGRVSTEAWLFNPGPSPDIIPRLLDVKITGIAQGRNELDWR
ncbi:hypothetical protein D3C80_1888160 [compost metagenome]